MKQSATLFILFLTINNFAQCSLFPLYSEQYSVSNPFTYRALYTLSFNENSDKISNATYEYSAPSVDVQSAHTVRHYIIPSTPVLTTKAHQLEVCEGNSTTLTAVSEYPIEWYSSYPPEGEPMGKGETFVTPKLTQGYSVYYAISNYNGIKSVGSEMEVVMVYPLPQLSILSSNKTICPGEKVSLKAFGTRFYEWNSGETSHEIVIQPEQTTQIKLTGINTAGCRNTIEFTQVVTDCKVVELIEVKEQTEIEIKSPVKENNFVSTIFPNPNSGEFQVKINPITDNTRLELFDAFGEIVYSSKVVRELSEINLSHVLNGIYTLRIFDQTKLLKQEKLIIQK